MLIPNERLHTKAPVFHTAEQKQNSRKMGINKMVHAYKKFEFLFDELEKNNKILFEIGEAEASTLIFFGF